MRWERLLDELAAGLDADEARVLDAEVAERTRRERARVGLCDRLAAVEGPLTVRMLGGSSVTGTLERYAAEWALLAVAGSAQGVEAVLRLAAVGSFAGLPPQAGDPLLRSRLLDRLALGVALRAMARDRAAVAVHLVDGDSLVGTIDAVGADHLDLALHPPSELRREQAIAERRAVPFAALACVVSRPMG